MGNYPEHLLEVIAADTGEDIYHDYSYDFAEWTPVTERLPESRVVVLVYCPKQMNIYEASHQDDGSWYIFGGGIAALWETVSHWMPLPKPPRVEQEVLNHVITQL